VGKISPHHIALAGLLHDIGKFMQLASAKSNDLSAFIQEAVPESFYHPFIQSITHLASSNDAMAQMIALADKFAVAYQSPDSSTKQVVSVFSQLGEGSKATRTIPIRSLSLNEDSLFPTDKPLSPNAYQVLWDEFYREAKAIGTFQKSDINTYVEAMQSLLQRYTGCVPCGYANSEDISLYDHSRIVAGLASCLSVLDEDKLQRVEKDNTQVATFIEGDISGIQRFLYSVPMRGATKQLRARSLYLQLLTEVIARYILRELGMPITNLIYVGGGHFYLLAPTGVDMNVLSREVDRILLKHHDGELYVALGSVPLFPNDFTAQNFEQKWRDLKQETGKSKSRRYANLPADELATIFMPRAQDGDDEISLRYNDRGEPEDDTEREAHSGLGKSLVEFSKKLKNAEAIVLGYTQPREVAVSGFQETFTEFGFAVDLVYTSHKQWNYPQLGELDYAVVQGIKSLPDNAMVKELERHLGCPIAPSLRYTVNVTPMVGDDFRPVEFDELAQASIGIKQIGVLRMDVDNLGHLFSAGFKKPNKPTESRASLARVATLSNALSLYFEGWVGEICRNANETHHKRIDDTKNPGRQIDVEAVYAVYSGGDDLFIVGRWDVLPQIAQTIHDDFSRYACNNANVHISAGITLHKGKYPLYLASADAEKALGSAKSIDADKNAISFLGQSVKWSDWKDILTVRDELYDLVKNHDDVISRSLIQMILHFYAHYEETRQQYAINKSGERQIVWGAWMWRSAYQFTRFADRLSDELLQKRVIAIYNRLKPDESKQNSLFHNIQLMGIAARWAEALTRSEKEK